MVVYTEKFKDWLAVGALCIFIMTLVDMFYSYIWTTFSRSLCEKFFGLAIYPHTCPMSMHNIANTKAHIAHNNGTCNGETSRAHSVCCILTSVTE